MSKNKKLVIIFVIVIVVLLVFVIARILVRKDDGFDPTNVSSRELGGGGNLPEVGLGTKVDGNEEYNDDNGSKAAMVAIESPRVVQEVEREEKSAENTAVFFVEMLGSYSTDANFQNVVDLYPIMTDSMKSWADDFARRNLNNPDRVEEAVNTSVAKVESLGRGKNRVVVFFHTQREQTLGGEEKMYDQEVRVVVIKGEEDEVWKVDEVDWM